MISFIVPAHNEELWIGRCLGSIRTTMDKVAECYEVIVVDDASTDSTPQIAKEAGVRTLRVDHRKISAVRNAGARAACGEVFFFVDADTQVNERAVSAALTAIRSGAAGGGCVPDLEGAIPLWGSILHFMACGMGRLIRLVGGCFLFCTQEAYLAAGGFSESLHAGEDIAFVQALKKVGRFVVPKPTVVTSARKLDVAGPWEVMGLLLRIAIRGPRYDNPWVRDILYGHRAQACRKPVNVGSQGSCLNIQQVLPLLNTIIRTLILRVLRGTPSLWRSLRETKGHMGHLSPDQDTTPDSVAIIPENITPLGPGASHVIPPPPSRSLDCLAIWPANQIKALSRSIC